MSDGKKKGKITLVSKGEKIPEEDTKIIFGLSSEIILDMFKILEDKLLLKDIEFGIKYSALEVVFVRALKGIYDIACIGLNGDKNLAMQYIESIFSNTRNNIKVEEEIENANRVVH
jgi:hypothetical protein